jgi:hypothetical protein
MRQTRGRGLLWLVLAGSLGCAANAPDDPGAIGVVTIALQEVPSGVSCLQVTVTGAGTVTRRFEVTPGTPAQFQMKKLFLGEATFTGQGFSAACAGMTSAAPTWASLSTRAVITHKPPVQVTLVMLESGGGVPVADGGTAPPADGAAPEGPAWAVLSCGMNRFSSSTTSRQETLIASDGRRFMRHRLTSDAVQPWVAGMLIPPDLVPTDQLEPAALLSLLSAVRSLDTSPWVPVQYLGRMPLRNVSFRGEQLFAAGPEQPARGVETYRDPVVPSSPSSSSRLRAVHQHLDPAARELMQYRCYTYSPN